jgi:PEP-CTERM/exosortase A-associated glycosyltransferase
VSTPPTSPPLILHVLDHALPELSGYSVRSHNLLRAQRAAGLSVVAVTPSAPAGLPAEESIDGVRYVRLSLRPPNAPQTPSLLARRIVGVGRWIDAELRRRPVSVIHAHSPVLNGLPALWSARRARLPVTYEVRGFWEDVGADRDGNLWRYRSIRALESWLLRRVDAVSTISHGLLDEIIGRGVSAERAFLAPNGVDTATFRPRVKDDAVLSRHGLKGRMVVGFVGHFIDYEGIDNLVRGFALVLDEFPQARLLLVGNGATEQVLRAEAHRLGMAENVVFAGTVPHNEVAGYYSVCDVLAYPRPPGRVAELTTPLKPLEAMAMGKAVLASDVGGLRELIRHGDTGILFPPNDPARLGQALGALLADPALRASLGANARRFVCEERTWDRVGRVYDDVYGKLLHATGGGQR